MKNLKYLPFERNRYFYGKLLSVDDFETEQKYMNDKRRMMNRYLHGTGVVCGMNVIAVDDTTLSIEMGLALDFAGREIVIPAPVTKKLAMMDGFDTYAESKEDKGYLYVCIDYDETEKEAVHSIAGNYDGASGTEYNKYAEGYRLYLTDMEPERSLGTISNLYEENKTLYWGNGIRVKQIMPRYANSNGVCEVRVIVENMGQRQPVSFSYDLELNCLSSKGKSYHKVTFDENDYDKSARYEKSYYLDTMAVNDVYGSAKLIGNSFELIIGERKVKAKAQCENQVYITQNNIKRELFKNYYLNAMENISKDSYQQSIYLAKVAVIRAGKSYIIDNVENLPFSQYISNSSLNAAIVELINRQLDLGQLGVGTSAHDESAAALVESRSHSDYQMTSGFIVMNLGIGGMVGQKFFSTPITHGLGLGRVDIILGSAYFLRDESETVYGSADIFEDKEAEFNADLAAKTDSQNGTFIIGMRLNQMTSAQQVKIYWTAIKNNSEDGALNDKRSIMIQPNMLYMNLRESYYLEAKVSGTIQTDVKWHVKEDDGGTIDENGMYTAPNQVGVYEVICESTVYSDMRASAFIVVRDLKK